MVQDGAWVTVTTEGATGAKDVYSVDDTDVKVAGLVCPGRL